MIRWAIRFLFLLGALLLFAPFLASSLWIDGRGITIPGHVYSKDERITVHYSSWKRSIDVTVEYQPPQEYSVRYLKATVTPQRFDELKKGDLVQLRYLRKEDTPQLPGANVLREMRMLPTVRLADQRTWSGLAQLFKNHQIMITAVVAVLLVLYLWRVTRFPGFIWAVALCVLVAVAAGEIYDFPMPVPSPQTDVRQASGTVKSLERVKVLFQDNHQRGFEAAQPIDIVGVQFVPAGKAEPVVAVDLIDAGSILDLNEHAPISIDYESAAPRTAWIHGATRQFPQRNVRGLAVQGMAIIAVIAALLFIAFLFGKGYRRVTGSSR